MRSSAPKRLIKEQDARAIDERARERDPLLLPAGKLLRLPPLEPGEPDELEGFGDAPANLAALHAAAAEAEANVLEDREVREERVGLKHGVHITLVRRQRRHVDAAELDPPFGRLLEAADHP